MARGVVNGSRHADQSGVPARRRLPLMVALVFLLGLVVSACTTRSETGPADSGSSSGADNLSQFLSRAGVQQEYSQATEEFSLPAGYAYPDDPFSATDPRGSFQKGYGRSEALFVWFCAWEKEWLTERLSDPTRAQDALTTLESVKQTDVYHDAWREIAPQIDAGLESAQLGDPTLIQNDVNANCMNVRRAGTGATSTTGPALPTQTPSVR